MGPLRTLLLLAASGCIAQSLNAEKAADVGDDSYTTGPETGIPEDTGPEEIPAWFVVRSDVTVASGVAVGDGAVVSLDVVDADLARTDCTVELDPSGVTGAGAEDDVSVWWDIAVRPTTEPCAVLPDAVRVGVGEMNADIRARLGAVELDAVADSLYGAYLSADDGDVVAFGYAGTATDLLGDDVATLPPPDGIYRLAPLYLVPLPQE